MLVAMTETFEKNRTVPGDGDAVHMVGIAGVGMNALAQVLLARGCRVSGSDRQFDQAPHSVLSDKLARMGCRLIPQDGACLPPETGALVISSAIEVDNPDCVMASQKGIPLWHRAELLAAVVGEQTCVAVAGTSGKTTITGMLGWVLAELGWDPRVVNGGGILNWKSDCSPGNVRMGNAHRWIVEVDESDGSLLRFHPECAVLANVSADHFPLAESRTLFHAFARQVKRVLVCRSEDAKWLRSDPGLRAEIVAVDLHNSEPWPVQVLGTHNQHNAVMVAKMAECLGYNRDDIRSALARFKGIERRLECVGNVNGAAVYDEYAHNPAKIRAAWTTVAERHDKVLGVWRPHGYGPLAAMASDLCAMWADVCRPQDTCYILPVYYAGGTTSRTMESEDLVKVLNEHGTNAFFVEDYATLQTKLLERADRNTAILCMGARDPHLPVFARALAGLPCLREQVPDVRCQERNRD